MPVVDLCTCVQTCCNNNASLSLSLSYSSPNVFMHALESTLRVTGSWHIECKVRLHGPSCLLSTNRMSKDSLVQLWEVPKHGEHYER